MTNGVIKEEDYLSWTDRQRDAYNFRMLVEIRDDVKRLTTVRLVCNSGAAFVGGIVGGVAAILGATKLKIFG